MAINPRCPTPEDTQVAKQHRDALIQRKALETQETQQQSHDAMLAAQRRARAVSSRAVAHEQRRAAQQQQISATELQKEKEMLQSGLEGETD